MNQQSKWAKIYWHLAPSECQYNEEANKNFRLYLMLTTYSICYFIFASLLNLLANIPNAALINISAATLCALIFLGRNFFPKISHAAFATCFVIFVSLLFHQVLLNQVALHNYIWLMVFPLLFVNFFKKKDNLILMVMIIACIFAAKKISFIIPIELHYKLNSMEIFYADIISIVLAMVFLMHLALDLKKIEKRMLDALDGKAKENAHLISILTHDISNQVTVINLACNKIKKGALEDVSSVEKIEKRTSNIERLINGVRISQQAMDAPLEIKTVSLIDLLEDLTVFFEERYPNNSSRLKFSYHGDSEYYVSIDRKIFMRNVIEPLIIAIMEMTGEYETIINFELNLGPRHVYMNLSSPSLKLFNTPLLSTINAVTLPEKEAVLCIVVAKKLMNKIGGELDLHPIKENRPNAIISFAFAKNTNLKSEKERTE